MCSAKEVGRRQMLMQRSNMPVQAVLLERAFFFFWYILLA